MYRQLALMAFLGNLPPISTPISGIYIHILTINTNTGHQTRYSLLVTVQAYIV